MVVYYYCRLLCWIVVKLLKKKRGKSNPIQVHIQLILYGLLLDIDTFVIHLS